MLSAPDFVFLLVEDEPNDVDLFVNAVQRNGLKVRVQNVGDVESALRYLSGEGPYANRQQFPFPDLIVSDLVLHGVSTLEFLNHCEKVAACRQVPRVVLTGTVEGDKAISLALVHGASRVYFKSGNFNKLRETVNHIYDFAVASHPAR